jgi:hypothetical protein
MVQALSADGDNLFWIQGQDVLFHGTESFNGQFVETNPRSLFGGKILTCRLIVRDQQTGNI